MTDIATHIRIFEVSPSDEMVAKRTTAISSISKVFSKLSNPAKIIGLGDDISSSILTNSKLEEGYAQIIEGAIKASSAAFVREDQELQLITCGLLAALKNLETASPSSHSLSKEDFLAASLWSALSAQRPHGEVRLERLRTELMELARSFSLQTAATSRLRAPSPKLNFKVPAECDWEKFGAMVKEEVNSFTKAHDNNSKLDQEELDILWWTLGDWSDLLNTQISTLPPHTAVIAAGVELGSKVDRLPSNSVRHLAMRSVASRDKKYNLNELIKLLGDDREKLEVIYPSATIIKEKPKVFPLLNSLKGGINVKGILEAQINLEGWASRALLESALVKMSDTNLKFF